MTDWLLSVVLGALVGFKWGFLAGASAAVAVAGWVRTRAPSARQEGE